MTQSANIPQIKQHIQDFRFEDLFIDQLGWDQYRDQLEVMVEDDYVTLEAFAEKRGMVAFIVSEIPEYKLRRKIEREVAKDHRENLIIYVDPDQTQQVWQWVRRETGKPLANRERRFDKGQSGESIAQVLSAIAFSLDEEDELTIVEVTSRVKAALDLEKVTKKFYDRFKKQHDAFLKFIEGIPDADLQRWYASVMLNRLMFIYFVQFKGFLDNDPKYLRNRLAQTDGNFYRDFLIPLFFQGFATKNHSPEVRRLLGDVPYLNGGLFLPHQIEKQHGEAIQIENDAFEQMFDFFDQYHWHLDERPLRDDDEINPDVLGYIFEKYINQKQMGAYYTKEDITEYISKNTVIPFLFDEARKAVKIAFEGEHTVWDLLVDNPDRYIYPAVRHGAEHDLPENIAAGLDDVSERGDWNTPAPSEYGLPTEIWRETVARRRRYEDICAKLLNGEVRQINDLITLNLDIQQFAQDVIDFTDSPDVIRAFWKAINRVSVLDPTCGSGAFLFAALNILEPLYEACLERMEAFLAEFDHTDDAHPQKYSDFREVMERIGQHPNRRYFILKSIIIQNLYGVDIMEEAIEIAKLRLFLKLVAQVDDKHRIEPLPDIDFNIRAGNTLVGFATQDEVRRALTTTSAGQGKLVFGEDQAALDEIERKAADIDRLFGLFRQQQTELGGEVRPEDKAELTQRLDELGDELNRLLARQYDVDPTKAKQYAQWQKSHAPFHWFTEFYGVLKNGGFDVIIGNPPYLNLNSLKEYQLVGFDTIPTRNLYPIVMEMCQQLTSSTGRQGYIVPVSSVATEGYSSLQKILTQRMLIVSSYDDRPSHLFSDLNKNTLSIILLGPEGKDRIHSSRLLRWNSSERVNLFSIIEYQLAPEQHIEGCIAKLGSALEIGIWQKIFKNQRRVGIFHGRNHPHMAYYSRKINSFIQVLDFVPEVRDGNGNLRPPSEFKEVKLKTQEQATILYCCFNSTLFRWFLDVVTDGSHLNRREIYGFPFDIERAEVYFDQFSAIAQLLSTNLQETSDYRVMRYSHDTLTIQCIIPKFSKLVIDDIDRVLARHYGFTDEELDFIINYDIKYRMGDDLFDD